jgi:hypothetical protein
LKYFLKTAAHVCPLMGYAILEHINVSETDLFGKFNTNSSRQNLLNTMMYII